MPYQPWWKQAKYILVTPFFQANICPPVMCLDVLHLESSCNELIRSTLTVMTSIPRIKLVNAIPAFGFGEILTYNWSLYLFIAWFIIISLKSDLQFSFWLHSGHMVMMKLHWMMRGQLYAPFLWTSKKLVWAKLSHINYVVYSWFFQQGHCVDGIFVYNQQFLHHTIVYSLSTSSCQSKTSSFPESHMHVLSKVFR